MSVERDREGNPAAYLGDGAYVSHDGFSVHVYADDGERITNRVVIEPEGLFVLVRFLAERGFPFAVKR